MRVTQTDLARELGIHQSTVSLVFSNSEGKRVAPETRRRILEKAREYGYTPSLAARALRNSSSKTIGVLNFVNNISIGLEKLTHLIRELEQTEYQLLVNDVHGMNNQTQAAIDMMCQMRVDGLVLKSISRNSDLLILEKLKNTGIHKVSMDGVKIPEVPRVRADKVEGAAMLARHLIQAGYRHITLLMSPLPEGEQDPEDSQAGQIIRGVQRVLQQEGKGVTLTILRATSHEGGEKQERSFQYGRELMLRACQPHLREREVMICNDTDYALGALSACGEMGLRVPEDVGIAGFNDDLAAKYAYVPLTVVSQPVAALAAKTREVLIGLICQTLPPDYDADLIISGCTLIPRKSTGS